jgi:hypothetical protein
MMTTKNTFNTWLLGQTHRDDPIGDLARDHKQDLQDYHQQHPGERAPFTAGLRPLQERLDELGACEGAVRALERAAAEYTRRPPSHSGAHLPHKIRTER